jgi:hypothetical protein
MGEVFHRRMSGEQEIIATITGECTEEEFKALCSIGLLSSKRLSGRLNNQRPDGDYQESDRCLDERYPAYEHTSHYQYWAWAKATPRAVSRSHKRRIPHEESYADQYKRLTQAEWLPYHPGESSTTFFERSAVKRCPRAPRTRDTHLSQSRWGSGPPVDECNGDARSRIRLTERFATAA